LALRSLFFKIEDNGATSLTHHLPAVFEVDCVLASASAANCRQVVEQTSSRTAKHTKRLLLSG